MKIPILNFLYDSQNQSVRYEKFNIKNYNTLSFETVKNVNFLYIIFLNQLIKTDQKI